MKLIVLCVLVTSCLFASVRSNDILNFFGTLKKPFEDLGADVAAAFDPDKLKEDLKVVTKPLEDVGAEVGNAFNSDNIKNNLEPLTKPLEETGAQITEAFNATNLQKNLDALQKPLNDALTAASNNECVMEVIETLVLFSQRMLIDVMACKDGSMAYIMELLEASEELLLIGKELQTAHNEECHQKTRCAQIFTVGISRMLRQIAYVSAQSAFLKLDASMCAANIIFTFADNIRFADLHDKCSS
uniref:Protein TsetseEP domain-containing protein n=1 Tax=Glossina brevipalpis TaxID=37001 RepID=A0A1A9X5M7_9MUSC